MAAKRVATSAINWSELAQKVPDSKRLAFTAIKSKQDVYLRTIGSLPESLPSLEWTKYQGRVEQKMVDEFKKKYEALNIPYPKDTLSDKIKAQATEEKNAHDAFVKDSKVRVGTLSAELVKWEAMMPVSEMNLEEAMQAVPELVPQHRSGKPEFWPFDAEYDREEKMKRAEEERRTYWDH